MPFTSKRQAAAYVAGLIDGEGSVVYGRWGPKNKKQYRVVVLYNTDPTIVRAAERACRQLGYAFVTSVVLAKKRKPKYVITVYRAEFIRRILDEVPIQAAKKKATLEAIVASFRVSKDPGEVLLRRLYERDRLPVEEVWKRLGLSRPVMYRYLKKYEIPLREEHHAVH